MVRFHPQWLRAREILRSGELGDVRVITAFLATTTSTPKTFATTPIKGGGSAWDIGCYPIVGARFLFESEPRRAIALIDRDPTFKTDRVTSALVDFGSGRRLDFTVSTQSVPYQSIQIFGTKKRLEISDPIQRAARRVHRAISSTTARRSIAAPLVARRCRPAISTSDRRTRSPAHSRRHPAALRRRGRDSKHADPRRTDHVGANAHVAT